MRIRGRSRLAAGRVALLPPAAFAVHQLRYEIAYGSHAATELRETGHSYLHSVVPWLVALIGLSVGTFLYRVGRACARRRAPGESSVSFVALWALCAVGLVAIFACQETLEGIFATGHPQGWAAVFGDGGWWAVPLAVAIGLVLAAVFHGARWVERAAARLRAAPWTPIPSPRPIVLHPAAPRALTPAPLLAGWCSRGPPTSPSTGPAR